MVHPVGVRNHIIERVLKRSGKYHWFESLDKDKTAFVVIDMQNTFCEAGSPAEVPNSRLIVNSINYLSKNLREIGIPIIWVLHANSVLQNSTDWELFFQNVVSDKVRDETIKNLAQNRQELWRELKSEEKDIILYKNRYSALISGSSPLERVLRNLGIDTILIGGTKTNVCCESTARDAMMLDFKVVMVEDCCAALSDDEHQATLETFIQQFGDVMRAEEVLERLN